MARGSTPTRPLNPPPAPTTPLRRRPPGPDPAGPHATRGDSPTTGGRSTSVRGAPRPPPVPADWPPMPPIRRRAACPAPLSRPPPCALAVRRRSGRRAAADRAPAPPQRPSTRRAALLGALAGGVVAAIVATGVTVALDDDPGLRPHQRRRSSRPSPPARARSTSAAILAKVQPSVVAIETSDRDLARRVLRRRLRASSSAPTASCSPTPTWSAASARSRSCCPTAPSTPPPSWAARPTTTSPSCKVDGVSPTSCRPSSGPPTTCRSARRSSPSATPSNLGGEPTRHPRHRVGQGPRPLRPGRRARGPHPDRRRHQPRQLGWPAGERRRPGGRHEHGDRGRRPEPRLLDRHRPGQADHRAARAGRGRGHARPGLPRGVDHRRRGPDRGPARPGSTSRSTRAPWSPRSCPARRPTTPASRSAT